MSKKKKNKDKEIPLDVVDATSSNLITSNLDERETPKKQLKGAEKLVKKLDKILSQLADVAEEAITLRDEAITSEASEKDMQRFTEMATVVAASGDVLYHLINRMSRKYTGKEIKPFKKAA